MIRDGMQTVTAVSELARDGQSPITPADGSVDFPPSVAMSEWAGWTAS